MNETETQPTTEPITIQPSRDAPTTETVPPSEDIHVRNYDATRRYTIDLSIADGTGERYRRRYDLKPGAFLSDCDVLDAGTYDVHAVLDTGNEARLRCRLSAAPEDTILLECGNGVVNLTQGVY